MSQNRPFVSSASTSATPREVFAALREHDTKSDVAIVERGQYYALVANRPARRAMRPLAIRVFAPISDSALTASALRESPLIAAIPSSQGVRSA